MDSDKDSPCFLAFYKSDLQSFDFVRFFIKLFTTKSTETVKNCQEYFGFSLPKVLWATLVAKFEVNFERFLSVWPVIIVSTYNHHHNQLIVHHVWLVKSIVIYTQLLVLLHVLDDRPTGVAHALSNDAVCCVKPTTTLFIQLSHAVRLICFVCSVFCFTFAVSSNNCCNCSDIV